MNALKLTLGLVIAMLCIALALSVPVYLVKMSIQTQEIIELALFILAFMAFFVGVIEK
jgi:hypothetical protein